MSQWSLVASSKGLIIWFKESTLSINIKDIQHDDYMSQDYSAARRAPDSQLHVHLGPWSEPTNLPHRSVPVCHTVWCLIPTDKVGSPPTHGTNSHAIVTKWRLQKCLQLGTKSFQASRQVRTAEQHQICPRVPSSPAYYQQAGHNGSSLCKEASLGINETWFIFEQRACAKGWVQK